MDAFSEILSGVKLSGAVFFSAEFSAPWGFASPASNTCAYGGARSAAPGDLPFRHRRRSIREVAGWTIDRAWCPEISSSFPTGIRTYMTSGTGCRRQHPLPRRLLSKIKSRDLSPMQAGGGGDSARYRLWVHGLRPLPEPADFGRSAAGLQGQHPDRSLGALAREFHPAPGRRSSFGTGRQRCHACQTL